MSQYDGFKGSYGTRVQQAPHPESFYCSGYPCCRNGYRKLETLADLREALQEIQFQQNDRLRRNMAGSLLVEFMNDRSISELYWAACRSKRSVGPLKRLRRKLPLAIKVMLNEWLRKLNGITSKPQE
jgi:hypothetical protein